MTYFQAHATKKVSCLNTICYKNFQTRMRAVAGTQRVKC